ncbi:MAG: ACP S-malonyltransferase [Oscillospiraceae bacterium]|nr:ACP S-malonyltransferase [Oscillospiraceae bacterium]
MKANAFLFTGQGAQFEGMGKDLYNNHKIFKNIADEASEHLKLDIINLSSDELAKTENAQPAIFVLSYGIYKILEEYNITPVCAAGFSLGEITALAASGVINLTDSLNLISVRGEVMREACEHTPGLMYSIIGAEDNLVEDICREVSEDLKGSNNFVIPANYNCPGQIVISGDSIAVETAVKIFTEKKIRAIKLNVAGAFHTKIMRYKQDILIDFLKTLEYNEPKFDLYSNLTGEKFNFDNKNLKSFMLNYIPEQMSNPVRFRECLENINKRGIGLFIEIGAGKVLSGFVRRACPAAEIKNYGEMI